ncbi:MAG: metalloregulator ArsR/SmtB family transcription factor [Candidatus Diapherotrites archaeon]
MTKAKYAKCFGALSSPLRLRIIEILGKKSMSVTELSKKLNEERSKVSHALAYLKMCGFVKSEKQGKLNIYSLTSSILTDIKKRGNIFDIIEDHVKKKCKIRKIRC